MSAHNNLMNRHVGCSQQRFEIVLANENGRAVKIGSIGFENARNAKGPINDVSIHSGKAQDNAGAKFQF